MLIYSAGHQSDSWVHNCLFLTLSRPFKFKMYNTNKHIAGDIRDKIGHCI